jgi:RNA polymerase sigma-70 factor (ECF subfamily)
VILCDLEGMTHQEAARRLGWPSGSMSGRLKEGRAILRKRLAGRGLPFVLLVVGVLVVLASRSGGSRGNLSRPAVRQEMAVFKEAGPEGRDLERFLERISQGGEPAANRAEAARVARASARVAERVMGHDPGRDRAEWRSYAARMQESARGLSAAARGDDVPALLTAARQLNESCVRCHLAFREEPKNGRADENW